jgi:hypothetical protein
VALAIKVLSPGALYVVRNSVVQALMNLKNTLATAAFGLIMSALAAQSASITISSLPYPITAPGTYVLTGNLTFSSPPSGDAVAAITIATSISEPVILDLKGFTLTGSGGNTLGVGIGTFAGTNVPNINPITVRNGTLKNFAFGVWAEIPNVYLSDITVNNIAFYPSPNPNNTETGVIFSQVNSSTISNCTFHSGVWGIEDLQSQGGNVYSNVTFFGNDGMWVAPANSTPLGINHCAFAAPLATPAP